MREQTFYSLVGLIEHGRERAKDCAVVSFDIFDTLFIRRVHDPDMVKQPVARFIAAQARQQGLAGWSWQKVQGLRDRFEQAQRADTGSRFADHEACYPFYMGQVMAEIFGQEQAEEMLSLVTDYELAVENTMLVPRGPFLAWLRELHGQGKRIFLISDIYLPASHLRRLVEHGGFAPLVTEVISSADTFLAKASGQAFPFLAEKYGLNPASWLHVGDNPISDGLRPAQFGIEALVLRDGLERMRKGLARRYWNYGRGRIFFRGRAVQQLMLPLEEENQPRPPLYVEGFNFLAPLLGAFIQRIAERCLDHHIPHIYFLSREGWMFERCWQAATPHLYPATPLPSESYLYVSRMALAGAACAYQGLTSDHVAIAFLPAGNRDFRDICRIFQLNGAGLAPHLARFGLALDTPLSAVYAETSPASVEALHTLLIDDRFQDEVRAQTRPLNDALIAYLEQEGFFTHPDVAIVDIGWLGTIQRFLHEAIRHRPDRPRLHGMLLGATRGIIYPEGPDNLLEGLLYDRNRFDLAGSSILYARDLFEEACRAPHPTLNGYRLTEAGPELVFRTQDDETGRAEQVQNRHFAPLQEGLLAGVKAYAAAVTLLGYGMWELKPWLNYLLVAKLAFPRASEVKNIRHQHHLDDFFGKNRPTNKKVKPAKELWACSLFALRFNPFLRLKFFLMALRDRLKE